MKRVFAILITALIVALTGCNGSSKENAAETEVKQSADTAVVEEHSHDANEPIESDNGKKWAVVPDMMQHIREMEKSLNSFEETDQTQLQDYFTIGNSLQNHIDLLTANCTMEGKGHDELHKWLVPFIGKVKELNNAESKEKASQIYKELKQSYTLVNKYFE